MFGPGFFGDLFDFDRDGQLDSVERALDMAWFDELMREEQSSDDEDDFG